MVIEGDEWLVQHHSHPRNPGPWRYSTRAYGRFGSFAPIELEPRRPRVLRHRLVVHAASKSAAAPPEDVQAAFVTPVRARLATRED